MHVSLTARTFETSVLGFFFPFVFVISISGTKIIAVGPIGMSVIANQTIGSLLSQRSLEARRYTSEHDNLNPFKKTY